VARPLDLEELLEHFTLADDELELLRNKSGATRLGFGLLLKCLAWKGRFPRGRGELPDNAVDHVARQVGVPPEELGLYDWTGRQSKRHRVEVRQHLGFRECTIADADKLTAWLAEHVAQAERRPERVREELLAHCHAERIEPPTAGRIDRMVASALHQAEQVLSLRIAARLPAAATARLEELVAVAADDADADEQDQEAEGPALLALIKSDPGNVSLETMLRDDADRDRQAGGGSRGQAASGAVRRPRAEGRGRMAGAGDGGGALASAHPSWAVAADAAGGAAARPRAGADRHAGGPADRHGAPHQRPSRAADHRGAGARVQAGHRQGDHPVSDRRGRGRPPRTTRSARCCFRWCPAGSGPCGTWSPSTRRRGRPGGARCRPPCGPPTPATTARA
jgi:hypothetical protein